MVLSGEIKPGDRIPGEIELMNTFKVGRSSIREAKKILMAKGLIDSHPGRGSFVKKISADEIINTDALQLYGIDQLDHLYELRRILEPQILKLAIQRATDSDTQAIIASFREMKEKIETKGEWADPGLQFHIRLVQATHNPVIIQFYSVIASMIINYQRPVYLKRTDTDKEIEIHRQILDCLLDRRTDLAETVMENHFNYVRRVTSS